MYASKKWIRSSVLFKILQVRLNVSISRSIRFSQYYCLCQVQGNIHDNVNKMIVDSIISLHRCNESI